MSSSGCRAVGVRLDRMLAQVIRQDRLAEPENAFVIEEIDTPEIAADEVLIAVMAAGINFNTVWAAQGIPIDVIAERRRAVGEDVTNVSVGDEVIVTTAGGIALIRGCAPDATR